MFCLKESQTGAIAKALRALFLFPFLLLIFVWQKGISPYISPACRFAPTCSEYSKQAFYRHGPLKGFLLTVWRILRCHPLNKGGIDPVPD